MVRPVRPLGPRASLVKVSSEDLAWIWPGRTEGAVAGELLDRGVAAVRHPRRRRCGRAPAARSTSACRRPTVEVVDTVGAGDAFCGGLLAHLWQAGVTDRAALEALDHDGWLGALSFAVTVAGLTCTRPGADPPWARDLVAG